MKFQLQCLLLFLINFCQVPLTSATYFIPICGSAGASCNSRVDAAGSLVSFVNQKVSFLGGALVTGIEFIEHGVRNVLQGIFIEAPKKEPDTWLEWFGLDLTTEEEPQSMTSLFQSGLYSIYEFFLNNIVVAVIIIAFICYVTLSRKYFESESSDLDSEDAVMGDTETDHGSFDDDVECNSEYETTSGRYSCKHCTCGSMISEKGDYS